MSLSKIRGPLGTVLSVFGRPGPTIVATAGDYAASLVTNDSTVTGATVKDALNALKSAMTFLNPVIPDIDASTNPNYPAATRWDCGFVSVAGKIGGASGKVVEVGDLVIAKATNAGGTEAAVGTSWTVLQVNILSTPLYEANALSELTGVAATARSNIAVPVNRRCISIEIDGNGFAVLAGTKTPLKAIRWAVTDMTAWFLRATDENGVDVADTCTVDVLASTTYNGALASICGAGIKPSLAAAAAATGTDLTGWTKTLSRTGLITLNVTVAPATAKCLTLAIDTVVA